MKKVLISLDDIKKLEQESWEYARKFLKGSSPLAGIASFERILTDWFDAQPGAPIYASGQFKIPAEVVERFLQSDTLVLDGTRCETCGQLGRIKAGVLSKIETTGGEDEI